MKSIKSIKGFIFWKIKFVKQQIDWNKQKKSARDRIKNQSKNISTSFEEGVKLIIIPHSDDEWFGCSQIIQKYDDSIFVNMDMSGGDTEEMHILRRTEMQNVADLFSRKIIDITKDKIMKLAMIIKEYSPRYIFVPSFIDWHEEHIQVIQIVCQAIKEIEADVNKQLEIVMYQISIPIPDCLITHVFGMKKGNWVFKRNTFKRIYKTQLSIPYRRFFLQDCVNGAYVNKYSGEVYAVLSIQKWIDLIKNVTIDRDTISKNINNISKIRLIVDELSEY